MEIKIYQQDWIPGFAAFLDDGSIAENAEAHVALNLGSLLLSIETKDLEKSELPYVVADSIMHEVIHCLESWASVEFNEERVESLLDKYRAEYRKTEEEREEEARENGQFGVGA